MNKLVDNGKVSTALITIVGVVAAALIADPSLLQALMGQYYVQYGAALVAILVALYNLYYPRNPVPAPSEPPAEA